MQATSLKIIFHVVDMSEWAYGKFTVPTKNNLMIKVYYFLLN